MTHTPIEKIPLTGKADDELSRAFELVINKINVLISHVTELEKEVERVKSHIIAVNSNHLMEWHIVEPKQEVKLGGAMANKYELKQECTNTKEEVLTKWIWKEQDLFTTVLDKEDAEKLARKILALLDK
jgi:hypothetical protein